MDKSLYKPKARWPLFVGVSFAALVVLYLFVTSSVFLRWFVLPRVAATLGSRMHVTGISFSPFPPFASVDSAWTPEEPRPWSRWRTC